MSRCHALFPGDFHGRQAQPSALLPGNHPASVKVQPQADCCILFFERFKAGTDKSALEILELAYASGKIGREEFLRKRDDLQARSSGDLP
jgi:hypothetical protein